MTKHMPGPYHVFRVNDIGDYGIEDKETHVLARTIYVGHGRKVTRRTAFLLAASADMYDALCFVRDFYQQNFDVMPVAFQTVDDVVNKAIEKAESDEEVV